MRGVTSGTATFATSGHALASDTVNLHGGWDWFGIFVGQLRIRATAADPAKPVFVAVGPAAAVTKYLGGVQYASVTAFGSHRSATTSHPGTATPHLPQRPASGPRRRQARAPRRCGGRRPAATGSSW